MTDLQTKIDNLQAQLDALKAQVAKPESGVWVPENGEQYFFLISTGEADDNAFTDCDTDKARLAIGNVFPTKEAAERHVERLKVIQELRVMAGGFKPNWRNDAECKWQPRYNHSVKKWETEYWCDFQYYFLPYFPTQEALQTALNALGDRMNVLLED